MHSQNETENAGAVTAKRRQLQHGIEELARLGEKQLDHQPFDEIEQARIRGILDSLNEDLDELLELKVEQNYFDEMIESLPHSEPTVRQILKDHHTLLADLTKIGAELGQLNRFGKARRLLHGWLNRFHELEARENRLVQDVWNVDVGTLD